MTMTRGLGGIVSDPGIDLRVRRALDRLGTPYLLVTDEGVTINDEGKIALRLVAGSGLSQSASGLTFSQTLNTSVTQTGNTAATETDLFSYTVPASTLAATGESLDFSASGTFAATASTDKKVLVYFGATTVYDSGNLAITAANSWTVRGTVMRSGASTQKCEVTIATSSATLRASASYAAAAETMSDAIVLRVRGNGTNANDVVGQFWKVAKQSA